MRLKNPDVRRRGRDVADPPTDDAMVRLDDIQLRYMSPAGETDALSSVSLAVAPGEFVALVGPSGCGKSTCLSVIAGLISPSSGSVTVQGRPVDGPPASVGYMLQHDHLLPWRTILDNTVLGAEVRRADLASAKAQAKTLLRKYGLDRFASKYPDELSGGMRQRAALIRTLVTQPKILLLDEPFSALDFQTRLTLSDEMAVILRQEGKTVVLVTHDIGEAIVMADRVLVMSHRPGTVKAEHLVDFGAPRPGALAIRSHPRFNVMFNEIWDELDVHVDQ